MISINLKAFLLGGFILSASSYAEGPAFPFEVPEAFRLNPTWIAVHHPVTTSSLEAQGLFDQGLTSMYAFNHDAAFWSFKSAAAIDPHMAMAYWGMALALGQDINTDIDTVRQKVAFEAIQKAKGLNIGITDSERDYISALATRYTDAETPDLGMLAKAYSESMQRLRQKYMDDPDAAVLYAESVLDMHPWGQWTAQGDPLPGAVETAEVLESVLKRMPMHLGANHYYIHAIEASKYPERALMSAERLHMLLPTSGHILHMPSHIYMLVGEYHKAALANEAAVKVDREYIRQFGSSGYPMHYMSHNLYFLSRAYSMEGYFTGARNAAKELNDFYARSFKDMPELEYYIPTEMFVLVRFRKWHDLLLLPPPPAAEMQVSNTLWHFGRGMAFANLGQKESSKKELAALTEARSKIPAAATYGYNKADTVLQLAELTLKSQISESAGNTSSAIAYMQEAIALQDNMHYNEPPDWSFSTRERLGGLLLKEQAYAAAEEVFRQDLQHHPRNGRALYGLWQSLKHQLKASDSYFVEQEFITAWQHSDSSPRFN